MLFEVNINTQQQHPIITLKNGNNCCTDIYAFGGFVNAFLVGTTDGLLNVIDGFTSVEDAIQNTTPAFKGSFLSPFTCRMKHGEFKFNGSDYKIDKFYLEPHAIHGILFDAVYTITTTEANDNEASVSLRHQYKGDDTGYPFPFVIAHKWTLKANNHLSVTTTISHTNSQAIPYAQGWHPYFTLGDNVDECSLQFDSNTMLEFDDTLLPTGRLITNAQFEKTTSLQGIFLDNCFELNATINQPMCSFTNDKITISIVPDKSYPYLQVYTPPHRKSIAIENLSGTPDCFNNGMGLQLIKPHIPAIFTTSYIVSVP
ncbi:MAG: aldose 1-epimerase [Pedobacter sp.]|nr:aldose 1-epimerase [Chitinophagaceae bacterium]